MSERIYRDPVHNIIRLRTDNDEGALIMHLIDTPEFQRLRRIKQLGLGLYTYQGAEHSRFTHSLGAFHLMSRVLNRLSEKHQIDKQDHAAARAAALLHDVGHGSFSHVMEKVLGFHHEKWTVEVVLSEETEVGQRLRSHSADLPAKVAAIIEGRFQPAALAQLVSSQLDVDRMDYLLRDSLMTGAKYGIYDLEWI
ncbi:MAG TPA: HD domain-containing protein, partial [Pyrinomonadaceae bacterium]|nr:HD domain-containing protein [Pyrinomonadaceae bacterium]